jgi:hypothetical protein
MDDVNLFVEDLPYNLKLEVSLLLHDATFNNIPYLVGREDSFKSWICALLKPQLVTPQQHIFV